MKETESVKEQTIQSVKWSSIERFSLQLAYFIIGIVMARKLSPSDYGAVGMIAIFISISQTFINSGFGNALIRKLDRTDVDYSTVFIFNFIVSIICYGLLFLISPWVASFFAMPILCPVLRVQAITLILGSLVSIHLTKLSIELDFKGIALRSLVITILSGATGIICAYSGLGVWSLVIQGLVNSTTNVLFIWAYTRWFPKLKFSRKSFKEMFSFGSKILASSLLNTIYNNLNTLVVGKFFSASDLGNYNRGTHFATLPVETANSVLGKVTYPILARLQNDESRLIRAYRKYICIMSLIIFFGCCLLVAIGKPLILFLLTEKWSESIIYLQIFAFAIMFDHISTINLNLLFVKGRSDLFFRLEVIKKTISTIILFSSIPFGVIGICISKIIYTQISIFINTYYTGKLFHLSYSTQWKDFSVFFIASVISCFPAFLICQFTPLHPILSILMGILLSIAIYYFSLRKNAYMLEVLDVAKSKLPFLRPEK